MKKLTRKSLDELAKTMPVIEESLQMSYVGGGNGTSANPYTQAEFDNMLSNDNWNGGYVEGMGYVATNTYIYDKCIIHFLIMSPRSPLQGGTDFSPKL